MKTVNAWRGKEKIKTIIYFGSMILFSILFMCLVLNSASAALTTNLNAYYNFDSVTNNRTTDSITQFGAVLGNGTAKTAPALILGKIGNALNFSTASQQWVNLTNATSDNTNFNWSFSINFWYNMTNSATGYRAVSRDTGGAGGKKYQGFTSSGSNDLSFDPSTDGTTTAQIVYTTPAADNRWHMATFMTNTTNTSIFFDGVLVKVGANPTGNQVLINAPTLVGRRVSGDFYNGMIDELGLWNRSLTATEVSTLYNSGNGLAYPFIGQNVTGVIVPLPVNRSYIYPYNNTYLNFSLNISALPSNASLNNCYYNSTWNSTVTIVNCNTLNNIVPINIFGTQTIYSFVNDSAGNVFMNQTTLSLVKISYNSSTSIGNTEGFNLNISSLDSSISQINLIYNGTSYPMTLSVDAVSNTIGNKQIVIPGFNVTSVPTFYFNILFSNGSITNSSIYNQTVNTFSLDNCTTNTILIMNLTAYDQDSLALINGTTQNYTIETLINLYSTGTNSLVTTYNASYSNVNNARICLPTGILNSSNYNMNYLIRFYGTAYSVQYLNGQMVSLANSTIPQTIKLYSLLLTRSQEFKVTYKDGNLLPVTNALIQVTRQYLPLNNFFTVESPSTDVNGQTIVHLVLGDVVYTIQVTQNGVVLATFNNVVASCTNVATGDCQLNLNAVRTTVNPLNFQNKDNLNYMWNWSRSTNILQFIFNTQDTSYQNISLRVVKSDNLGNTTLCTQSLVTSAGTLSCTINPNLYGNLSFSAYAYYNGNQVSVDNEYMGPTPGDTFGGTRVLIGMLLYCSLTLLFITSPIAIIVGSVLGVIFSMLLFVVDGGSFFGNSSIVLWFIIAGGIIIWQINRQNKQ